MRMLEWLANVLTSREFLAVTSAATLGGLTATLVSLRLALRSISDGRTIIENSSQLVNGLRSVGDSLTTHRVGELPDCTDVIARLVADAQKSIEITAVHPGAGIFSAPEAWVRLSNALNERQSQKVAVELLFGTRAVRMKLVEAQYSEAFADWLAWSRNPANAARLELFAKRYHHSRPTFDDAKEFAVFGLDTDERIVREVFWAAKIEYTDAFVPLVSWIKDDNEAFFAIANNRGRATGFITRDQNMIQSLKSVRDLYPRVGQHPQCGSPADADVPG